MNLNSGKRTLGVGCGVLFSCGAASLAIADLPSFSQHGDTLAMDNGPVRVEYHLSSGTADFFWDNARKISGFFSSVTLSSGRFKSTSYPNHGWSAGGNQAVVVSTGDKLPTMKQYFVFDRDNSFLTRVEMDGPGLSSRRMAPLVAEGDGVVDVGSYGEARALIVPFDNDHFIRYNAKSINNTGTSYEVSAFYDNTSRKGLVIGSVTHDTWKTGVYFSGAGNKLNALSIFGGATSHEVTWDVMPHGAVVGNTISSPTAFVGFGDDWRTTMEDFADENVSLTPPLPWTNGVPFGWNSWGVIQKNLSYAKAIAVSDFFKTNLQPKGFENGGVVYVNLDSFWNNLGDEGLAQFAGHCHANGQKAGIYWAPFAYWGGARGLTNSFVEGTDNNYKFGDIVLRDGNGSFQTNDNAIAIDPTHPGTKLLIDHFVNLFLRDGFDFLKLDFLSHGALEGVHYDKSVTTGIQAYNQGMKYILQRISGRMFIDESIGPIFPYQYANGRRISCDAFHSIENTEYVMQSLNYGWWMSGRLYAFSNPDQMVFTGGDEYENQSRLISGAITGTFLDGDDLSFPTGQALAERCLTHEAINEVARAGRTFRPVEGNTGRRATDLFARQDGPNWCLAVFNYTTNAVNRAIDLRRVGIEARAWDATDLWSGTRAHAERTFSVNLKPKQAKLFKLTPVVAR